ncbi:hypothetical protein Kpol_534p17 [Vanderwaltozyma polyspora DSM 70294]|uniref:HECT-type E3 ubiquitin transferase n=1 Tax=Vanderwaltozyma polyspora (strain ATCC 22028 / DSM 70294 / BCRC 21397 / CBS 2163 / NBRC 10782 / NRRL Y-8283 / UCD 57-17) TaxID=436907 RepID=A7TJJ5_VANPO|nr:uncharacterized protein Kpol_534p17 [Vanderwaltozyma polyspora DSM 70294]EDO17538.1 hypothetical protein Kpol_534p17 [Vanderwaltozyma polyspora DSM 70294]
MFNFTGQTKRRNVNLGTSSRASKRDILLKAQQERERRAVERLENDSITFIQSVIRRELSNREICGDCVSRLGEIDVLQHLLLTFGNRLLKYVKQEELKRCLQVSQPYISSYSNGFGNSQMLSLLSGLADDNIFQDIISCFNLSIPLPSLLIQSLKRFILSTTSLSQESCTIICDVIQKWCHYEMDIVVDLYEIDLGLAESSDLVIQFFTALGSRNIIPGNPSNSSLFLENLSIAYQSSKDLKEIILLVARCFHIVKYEKVNEVTKNYTKTLFDGDFCDRLVTLVEDKTYDDINVSTLVSFVDCSVLFGKKDSIVIKLLSRPNFLGTIYNTLQNSHLEEYNDENVKDLLFFIHLLETYLLVTTDHELLNNSSTFSIGNLIEFSSMLKKFVFDQLWSATTVKEEVMITALSLLRRIYFKDSRLHFCTSKENPQFWVSEDDSFLSVNVFKYLDDYEKLYREYADKKLDIDDSISFNSNNTISDKIKIFQKFKNSNTTSYSTRQFKKFEILIKAPFFIPFDQRVDLFYTFIAIDKHRLSLDSDNSMLDPFSFMISESAQPRSSITISREHVLEDAYESFNQIGERIKSKLSVTFVNEFGPEAGIDGGGITKEFLTSVSEEGFKNEKYKLFLTNDKHELYPNLNLNPVQLKYLWFLGKIVGKCLYDRVLIDVKFTDFFVKKLLNYSNHFSSSFDDLSSLDSSLYQNLVKLLTMSAAEIEDLDLTFELTDESDVSKVVELLPNGSSIKVNKGNVLQYIFLISDFKLNKSQFRQVSYFHGGMSMIIAPHWMEMFNSVELQMLISGGDRDIDLNDLKQNTVYGGFEEGDVTVKNFWEILKEFEPEERLNFIKFVTSVPRGPLQGFGSLNPKFGIRNSGSDSDRLPTASTCVNLLKLPDYKDKKVMKEKLLYAINSGARFDLS